jgi:hypothetical protein
MQHFTEWQSAFLEAALKAAKKTFEDFTCETIKDFIKDALDGPDMDQNY